MKLICKCGWTGEQKVMYSWHKEGFPATYRCQWCAKYRSEEEWKIMTSKEADRDDYLNSEFNSFDICDFGRL